MVRPLSAGGMGAVYVVEQLSTQKLRALKLMHPQLAADEASRRRFDQEARVGARIPSDHIVEVTAAGIDAASGAPYLVMELLEGEDLETTLRRRGALAPGEVAQVMDQICHAVGSAHAAGIVHRDLKPANVFLATARRTDAAFTVKVLDFGIAKLVSEQSVETAAMGSPLWLAPEQTERRPVTPATDVWALGLIAYTLLTGRSYWKTAAQPDASLMHVMREVLFDPIDPASSRAASQGAHLPTAFDRWFARCVAREPTARYQNAGQLFADLAPLLGYQRPSTGPSGGAALVPPAAGAVPYVTRYDSGSVPSATTGSVGAVSVGNAGGATSVPVPGRVGGHAPLAKGAGRAAAGGLLAFGCAGTALIATLVVALVSVTAVVLLRAPPASDTARPGATAPAEVDVEDDDAPRTEGAEPVAQRPQPGEPPQGALPGSRVTARTAGEPPPAREADRPAPAPDAPAPAATKPASKRKAVVSALLGGSGNLPPDGASIVRSRVPQFQACYERGIAGDDEKHFGESMILYLHIQADGGLRGVESRIDTAPPGVGTCILPIVRSLRFSAPPAGPVQGNLIISFKTE